MTARAPPGGTALASEDAPPSLVPCLMLKRGQVYRPGPEGPVVARSASGGPFDPFDVVDRLTPDHPLLYVVDLDGIERQDPQLDYVQELSRDIPLWVDSGVRTADQAIDVLVAGAHRVVLSSAYLQGPRQLARAWRLSPEIVFEIELEGPKVSPVHADWGSQDAVELARTVRAAGPDHLILSPRERDPDWTLVRTISAAGPTWVDGSFTTVDAPRLAPSGARGGIYHLDDLFDRWEDDPASVPPTPTELRPAPARDDEN